MLSPKLTFYTGVGEVTGANFLFEYDGLSILIDCGLLQGIKFAEDENRKAFPYDPSKIDFLFVTHAHMDHIGRIPKLVKNGFKGVIYSTTETRSLSEVMLPDALRLLQREAIENHTEPLYSEEDIKATFLLWKDIAYHTSLEVNQNLSCTLLDAGHILGSSMFQFSFKNDKGEIKKILFSGDLGNSPTPLLRDTEEVKGIDYLVMDSVYGDRNHEPLRERRGRLQDIVNETIERKGALLIPAFSLERSQVILYEINNLVEEKKIPQVPVFLDSPLAIAVTEIYKRSENLFNAAVEKDIKGGDNIFNFPKLTFTTRREDSLKISHTPNPKIIIAGSGMSAGGRIINHEKEYLGDPKSTLLLVGYQAAGSLGRLLADGEKEVTISGEKIKVRAHIENVSGYSAHKDSDHLLEFAEKTRDTLKQVFVVMGEPKSSLFLVQKIRDYLDVNALYPERGKTYELR